MDCSQVRNERIHNIEITLVSYEFLVFKWISLILYLLNNYMVSKWISICNLGFRLKNRSACSHQSVIFFMVNLMRPYNSLNISKMRHKNFFRNCRDDVVHKLVWNKNVLYLLSYRILKELHKNWLHSKRHVDVKIAKNNSVSN